MPLIQLENGININYQLKSKDQLDLLLLIHGYGSCMYGYDKILNLLIKDLSVLRFDLRGHGDSDKPLIKDDYEATKRRYTIEQFADDAHLLEKKLGLVDKYKKIVIDLNMKWYYILDDNNR